MQFPIHQSIFQQELTFEGTHSKISLTLTLKISYDMPLFLASEFFLQLLNINLFYTCLF